MCKAEFIESPQVGEDMPAVNITSHNGLSVRSDAEDASKVLSDFFGKNVCLIDTAPDDFTIDRFHPDVEGAVPEGHQNMLVSSKAGAALFEELGVESPVPKGSLFDGFPLTMMTTSTLAIMSEL